ncbi:alpha/beta fold hydrolase [Jongsikchunia kroppenstedtii]|uniref:alpha/beta fold hydrolase n=1 Tax=Jongsikchunia kroppenstedtii TaxID=1121721 RepID=UPI001FDEDCE6|nr:alpha/beta hydrolase [Jongsikchunia kroppenstedtii]
MTVADASAIDLAPLDRTTDPSPGTYQQVGDFRLFVRRTGADDGARPGGTAVYVHGLGGSSLNWTDLGQILDPVVAGHVIDLPGFGYSDPPSGGDYSLRTQMRAVIGYLEHVQARPGGAVGGVHLIGNSLGGVVCARVAQERPDLVRTLTLISPAYPDMRPRLRRLSFLPLGLAKIPTAGPAAFRYLGSRRPELQVMQTLREIMVTPERLGAVRIRQAVEHAVDRSAMAWAADALASSFATLVASWAWNGGRDHWSRARRIGVPALVLWGSQDLLVSAEIAPKVVRMIPGARLVMFSDAGHVSQMEMPEETAHEICRHIGIRLRGKVPDL